MGRLFMNSPLSSLGKLSSVNKRNNQRAGFLSSQEDTPPVITVICCLVERYQPGSKFGNCGCMCDHSLFFREGTFPAYSIRRWGADELGMKCVIAGSVLISKDRPLFPVRLSGLGGPCADLRDQDCRRCAPTVPNKTCHGGNVNIEQPLLNAILCFQVCKT